MILLRLDAVDLFDHVHAVLLIGKAEIPLEERRRGAAHGIHADVVRVEIVGEYGKRRGLCRRAVREQIAVERFDDLGDLRDQAIDLHLTEQRDQHALLAVDAVRIARFAGRKTVYALADAAVIQEALSVYVLQTLFIRTALDLEADVHVVLQTAAQIDEILQGGHRDRVVIIDLDPAEHPLRRVTDFFKALRIEAAVLVVKTAAAVQGSVQFIDPLYVGNARIRVARKRDQVGAVLVEIDRKDHHDVRMPFFFAVPGLSFRRIVDADQKDIDDILHHCRVCLLDQLLIRIDRRFGRLNLRRFRSGIRRRRRGLSGIVRRDNDAVRIGRNDRILAGLRILRRAAAAGASVPERGTRAEASDHDRDHDAEDHDARRN